MLIIIIGDSTSGHDINCCFIWIQQQSKKFTTKYAAQDSGKILKDKAAQ